MSTSNATQPKVWLITGCSTGLGRAIAVAALAHGDKVVATARNPAAIADLAEKGALALALDVTASDEAIATAIKPALEQFGRVDVLVNNAGYCSNGALEEASAEEVYSQFNTNVFGGLAMLRAVLPTMRAQKSGVVAFIGSMTGWRGWASTGLYCSTKFALAGLTQALRQEVAGFGIDVTCLELGNFRTEILARSQGTGRYKNEIPDYAPLTEATRNLLTAMSGAQPGDTDKAAELIVELLTKTGRAEGKTLPSRIPMGADGVAMARGAIADATKDLDEWESILTTGLEFETKP